MKYRFSHQQKLLQKMSLTSQMRLSIALLGMSASDLNEYIEAALAKNPFLQKLEEMRDARRHKTNTSSSIAIDPDKGSAPIKDRANPRETLLSQVKMLTLNDNDIPIVEYLIYEMDPNGYLKVDPEEAAGDLGVDAEDVDRCIDIIQEMDPPGIGARNLQECLQLQLKRAGKEKSLEYRIADEYLSDMATGDIKKIALCLKSDEKDVKKAVDALRKLNPRPAGDILGKESEHIVPELTAKVTGKNFRLEINRGAIPSLRMYNPYEKEFDIIKDPEAKKFMKENMDFAKGLIDGLSRRENTLCKVAQYILEAQMDALLKRDQHIKKLTIQEVAKALEFHPSTISRAISKKYVQIDNKSVALGSLLSHGMKHRSGTEISKASVKEKIRAMVKSEDPASPLNDSQIHRKLNEEGISLERRTVAKYRNALRILPHHLRKRKVSSVT